MHIQNYTGPHMDSLRSINIRLTRYSLDTTVPILVRNLSLICYCM